MKLHDLSPAPGSRRKRTRVGRGIAAGQGKTAGRGTKGQKARAGGSIQPWFEGGQTPLHIRIPKLRGFKNPFRLEYEIVNVGRISALAELGVLDAGTAVDGSPAGGPTTVTQELLLAAGLVRTLDKPLKILGQGDVDRPLFVVADACSKSAREKIEAAGGTVQILELPVAPTAAVGLGATDAPAPAADATTSPEAAPAAEATEPGSPAEPGEDA